ncbi:TPA: hypothetical protein ACH3X1_015771 [Trebouxia sp. C0004]
MRALSQDGHSSTNTAIVPQEDDDGNDEDEEGDELLNLCSSLDGVIGQLQKHMNTLQSYQRQPYESTETSWAVQSKIEDMYDIYTPALAMLVEPLLPRAWRKELDKQKILKGDVDTDLFAISIGERDIAQASEEEGSPLQGDSIVLEGPEMAT